MYSYRVSKYDPSLRNDKGEFTLETWTSRSDIGQKFSGNILTESEYQKVEDQYIETAIELLEANGCRGLEIRGLENHQGQFNEGDYISLDKLGEVFRSVLREEYWARFEGKDVFVHFGYDFYMYVGLPSKIQEGLNQKMLFIEAFPSPYSN